LFVTTLLEFTVQQQFPDDFLWGVASAGHQNEGGNTDSDTWFAEHVRPTVFREPSGKACNGWELWREDVDLAAGMNLNACRFSVEWSRVEPAEGEFSAGALAHYAAIAGYCLARGLAPVVTFNHFTSPHWFALRAGWLNPEAPALFARYCDRVMAAFGDTIAYAVTLNEPDLPAMLAWAGLPPIVRELERATLDAAGAAAGVPRYRMSNVVLPEERDAICDGMTAGHRAARAAIKARRPELPVGFALAMVDDQVYGDDPGLRDRKRAEVYQRWLELAREDDFIAIQNYERLYYDAERSVNADGTPAVSGPMTGRDPASLGCCARYAHQMTGVPVLVTEHGMQTDDDGERLAFIEPSLAGLADAISDGVPVLGYHHWTLMDNFEWIFGYEGKLGLYSVDRETFARTAKPSAAAYAALVKEQRRG
jgi:beta-glucosidase